MEHLIMFISESVILSQNMTYILDVWDIKEYMNNLTGVMQKLGLVPKLIVGWWGREKGSNLWKRFQVVKKVPNYGTDLESKLWFQVVVQVDCGGDLQALVDRGWPPHDEQCWMWQSPQEVVVPQTSNVECGRRAHKKFWYHKRLWKSPQEVVLPHW